MKNIYKNLRVCPFKYTSSKSNIPNRGPHVEIEYVSKWQLLTNEINHFKSPLNVQVIE